LLWNKKIGDSLAEAEAAAGLGNAYLGASELRDVNQAEHW
jgi:hypothetical protein